MDRRQDLEIILRSRTPLIVMETRDESRVLRMLQDIGMQSSTSDYLPLFRWTITDGLQRLDIDLAPQLMNSEPADVLKHIRAVSKPGIYVLLDFHPFLDDPVHVRLIKDICIHYRDVPRQLVLISHQIRLPRELEAFSARVDMALPGKAKSRGKFERSEIQKVATRVPTFESARTGKDTRAGIAGQGGCRDSLPHPPT